MTKANLLRKFKTTKPVSIKWYWEPFHKNGLSVAQWMDKRLIQLSPEERMKAVTEYLDNISVLRAPEKIKKLAPEIVDKFGRLAPLDPAKRIAETLNTYKNSDFFVSKISELKKDLKNFIPELQGTPEYVEIRKLWASTPDILARFDKLTPWEQLEVLECLFGLTKSHTTLHFKLIDASNIAV